MANVHEVQGYALVLDKVIHITRVFEAANDEGAQFNIRLIDGVTLKLKFPDRAAATLDRDLLVRALRD